VVHDLVEVDCERLDDYRFVRQPQLLKIDVEGHELELLRGGEQLLERARPAILVEIEQRHHDREVGEIFDFLSDRGYDGWFVRGERLLPLELFDVQRDQLRFLTGDPTETLQGDYVYEFLFRPRGDRVVTSGRPLMSKAEASRSLQVALAPTRSRLLKRCFDTLLAAVAFVLLAPLLVVVGVAIRLDSPGPALYRQLRRGQHDELFRIAKFRTMRVGSDASQGALAHLNDADWPLFKIKGRDPRVTRVGRVLRSWSIDELPQLWNVLKGEMSLVGPRPLIVLEADALVAVAASRVSVRPGITGPWQVGGRHDLKVEEMIRLDCDYVANGSLQADLAILVQTVGAVLRRKGAY
jgi:lipopolysaccharide/colanic/teichoic acid biosynthesis glycosyltransferase